MSDLISRKALIKELQEISTLEAISDRTGDMMFWVDKKAVYKIIENLPTIQPQGIDKDRLIKDLKGERIMVLFPKDLKDPKIKYWNDGIECAIDIVNQQPTSDGWIPCSERLPDENMWCLVTYQSGEVEKVKYCTTNNWGQNDECITAWQPLPQPYKESE